MSRQSKNHRKNMTAHAVSAAHNQGHRAGPDTMKGAPANKGRSQAKRENRNK